mgnify:FL=1
MGKIELKPPQGYSELDSASVKQFGELLFNTFEGDAINQFNEYINFNLSKNGATYTTIDSAAQYLANAFAESGSISKDSAYTLVHNAIWDNISNTEDSQNDKTADKDRNTAASVGALIGMENSNKYLQQEKVEKSAEFQQIKDLYGLDDKATKDQAYGLLLNDLTANELESIYNSEEGLKGTYKSPSGKPLTRKQMMPIPLSTTKFSPAQGYGGGSSATHIYQSKMTKEEFAVYLRKERYKYLIDKQKVGGIDVDFNKTASAANDYAEKALDKNYDTYVNYQREILKDIDVTALSGALTRLESAKEVEDIFTK